MHLLVVEGAKAANGRDERWVDGKLGRNIMVASRVLTEVLLQLELPL